MPVGIKELRCLCREQILSIECGDKAFGYKQRAESFGSGLKQNARCQSQSHGMQTRSTQ
jgi:hypothetical protein